MEHPSAAWLEKFDNETLVPEQFIKVTYDCTEIGVQADAAASATAQVPFGNIENTTKDYERTLTKYATGETNMCALDGSFNIVPSSANYGDAGFVSHTLVSDSNHPRIVLSFSRVHTREVPGLTIVWSSMLDEWATQFTLTAYNGANVVSTINVSNNYPEELNGTRAYSETEWAIKNYDSIAIDILKWSVPNRRARIEWIMVGFHRIYDKSNIMSFTHTSSRDPISAQLSKDSIEFTLDNSKRTWDAVNPKGAFRYLYERQEVNVKYGMDVNGETQWINGGKFYLSEWSVPANGLEASFVARDAFEFLMNTTYTGQKSGTLYQLCYSALETLPTEIQNTFPNGMFYIAEELKEYSTDFSSESTSYKNSDVLQLAANAAGMALYQTRDGQIRIERVNLAAESGTEVYEIAEINNYEYPEITFSSRVKNVSCSINSTEHLYPEASDVDGVTQSVSNEFLTETMLTKSKNSLTEAYATLSNRKKVELEYRASPHIDALDHILLKHEFGSKSNVFVTESKYEFTGCFKGTVSGYMLDSVSNVSLTPTLPFTLIYGQSNVLTAELSPYSFDLPVVSWRADPEDVVSLHILTNDSGKSTCEVKYRRKGNAVVSAYVGSVSSGTVAVTDSPAKLTLNASNINVHRGNTQTVTATFSPHTYDSPQINWYSTPSGIVQLEIISTDAKAGTSTCKITGLTAGSAIITAEAATVDKENATCAVTDYIDLSNVTLVADSLAYVEKGYARQVYSMQFKVEPTDITTLYVYLDTSQLHNYSSGRGDTDDDGNYYTWDVYLDQYLSLTLDNYSLNSEGVLTVRIIAQVVKQGGTLDFNLPNWHNKNYSNNYYNTLATLHIYSSQDNTHVEKNFDFKGGGSVHYNSLAFFDWTVEKSSE